MIKYRVGGYDRLIEKREVVRETEKCVFYESEWRGKKTEERELKKSSHYKWFDSWEDAKEYLLTTAEGRLNGTQRAVERAQQHLDGVKSLTEVS